ncbi:lamin tail domain-containing protein [Reichenbachiella ulvae]|uniref:Lamin tail domain-containing protein n=1 Tax=Reichenbachiella ulvae TaxID=2980104 RepID=A0ABT3CX04_9BACT|nr:lamin tail domain-containing protein [Reichenbachiella ulvae]MCV9388236.1 lamin tail domain-containing protein [Reichenbachiella ulvae]
MKYLCLALLLSISLPSYSQFQDDFSDGDFTQNPAWSGDEAYFEVESGQLNSNGPDETSSLYLSTPIEVYDYTQWEFLVDLRLSPSGSNRARVYLMSDQASLEESLNGYFIQIGQSGDDEIDFYRQDGGSTSLLFSGSTLFTGDVLVRIRVKRDVVGAWQVFADPAGGSNFNSEGEPFLDDTYSAGEYLGVVVEHTKTQKYNYYFDDFSVEAYDPPFALSLVKVESNNTLRLSFTSELDLASAETSSNYDLSNGFGMPSSAEIDPEHANQVLLTFADDFTRNDYMLGLNNIQNSNLDESLTDIQWDFEINGATAFREIVINEIYADYNPTSLGLPDEEYVELYNLSDYPIKLGDFSLNEEALDDFVLASKSYVIVTDDSNISEFEGFGDMVTLSSFPSLLNGGMELLLKDNLGNLVDSVTYSDSWYGEESKSDGGFALEQINPERDCNYAGNWLASSDERGGTPGEENSVYDSSPDIESPAVLLLEVVDATHLQLTFDEPMDVGSLQSATYNLSPGLEVSVQAASGMKVQLELANSLVSDTHYSLTINGATDCAGNALTEEIPSFYYDVNAPVLVGLVVLSDTELQLTFDEGLLETVAEEVNNYAIGENIATSATLNADDSTELLLTFEEAFIDDVESILSIGNLEDLYGNTMSSEIQQAFTYNEPFAVDTLIQESSLSLLLRFNQDLEANSATQIGNFSLDNGYGQPIEATLQNENEVILTFGARFNTNDYQLTLNDIQNADLDEALVNAEIEITIESATAYREIVINEIYADYNPTSVGLPDEEYVELYNLSDYPIKLEGFRLNEEALDDFVLASKSYVIVTDDSNFSEFESFGDVVTISSFPSLLNGGMELLLKDNLGNLVDSVTYSDSWYAEESKSDGGFSLEQINPERECNYAGNWLASSDEKGGTPGQENSVYDNSPDIESPDVMLFEVVDSTHLQLTFDEPMDLLSLQSATYDLNPDLEVSLQASTKFNVQLELANPLVSGTTYALLIDAVTDCAGNALDTDEGLSFYYDVTAPVLQELAILSDTELQLTFDEGLLESAAEDESNYTIGESTATSATLNDEDSTQVLLTFEEVFIDGVENILSILNLEDVYGNALASEIQQAFTYESPFGLDSLIQESTSSLLLRFNQSLDPTSSTQLANYAIDHGYGQPLEATLQNGNEIILTFSDAFNNNHYQLTLNNIQNADFDETLMNPSMGISIEVSTSFREIVINEIYADYNPTSVGLPDEEYVELYNLSDYPIKLRDFTLNEETLDEFVLASNAYVIVTDDSNLSEFEIFGDVVTISSFPSLLNGGMELLLKDNLGNLVDSITYSDSWYTEASKSDGGFSLEQISPERACNYASNWMASSDEKGGTPGQVNSVYDNSPDIESPDVMLLEVVDATHLRLTFDEPMDVASLQSATYSLSPYLEGSIQSVTNIRAQLELANSLVSGTHYSLTINGATDCAGNALTDEIPSFYYDVNAPVLEDLVVLSDTEVQLVFDEGLLETAAEDENNYAIGESIATSATLNADDSTQVLLTFDEVFIDGVENILSIGNLEDLYGNTMSSEIQQAFTYEAPFGVDTLIQETSSSLILRFNQDLDATSATQIENFSLDSGYGHPSEAIIQNGNEVVLVFGDAFNNNDYQLTLNDIQNADLDEALANAEIEITIESATAFRDIVINEIYADYNPTSVGLPDEEYIELYNLSDYPIKLGDFTLNEEALDDFVLASKSYVIVTDDSNFSEFESFGDVVTLSSFPSLLNGGMQLLLKDNLGSLVDSVTYSDTWYGEESKSDGGFSLEQINPERECNYAGNWLASSDEKGGTPGQENSVYDNSPDIESPDVLLLEVVDATHLQLAFDEPMDVGSLQSAIYTLSPDLEVAFQAASGMKVQLELANSLVSGTHYSLTINGATDCAGNALTEEIPSFYYDVNAPVLEDLLVLSDTELQLAFDEGLLETVAEDENNYAIGESIATSATLNVDDSTQVLLTFEETFSDGVESILSIGNLEDLHGNTMSSNVEQAFTYEAPFAVDTLIQESSSSLLLRFNQSLDPSSTSQLSNYFLNHGYGQPSEATLQNGNEVILTFGARFNNNDYQLTLSNIQNADLDESLVEISLGISIEVPTSFREIVINEIYADYNPTSVGLPDEEFVELYNLSDYPIKLGDFTLNEEALDDFVLASSAYVIVTDDSNFSEFESFGDVVTITSFPSLLNGGMQLLLKDNLGNLVDSVTYADSWYGEESKSDGGFALEQINPDRECNYFGNWLASSDERGGTPGQVNSVYDNSPDLLPPSILSMEVLDSVHLSLAFDEPLNIDSLKTSYFSLSPENEILSVTGDVFLVILELKTALISGTSYKLSVEELSDCAGNSILNQTLDFHYDVKGPELNSHLLLSDRQLQLTFDEPIVLDSLQDQSLIINPTATIELELVDPNTIILSFDSALISGQTYELSFSDFSDTLGNVQKQLTTLRWQYINPIDTLHVLSGHHLDLHFSVDLDISMASNPELYEWVESGAKPISVLMNPDEAHRVQLIFQEDFDDNKELSLRISGLYDHQGNYLACPLVPFEFDTSAPRVESVVALSAHELEVVFSEKVDRQSAETIENYESDERYPLQGLLQEDRSSVLLEFEKVFEEELAYNLLIDDVEDLFGNAIGTRKKVPFVFDQTAPRLDSVFTLSSTDVVLIFHEEMDSISVLDSTHFLLTGIHPKEVLLDRESQKRIILHFAEAITGVQTLELEKLQDLSGNEIDALKIDVDFEDFHLVNWQMNTANQLVLDFNFPLGESFLDQEKYSLQSNAISSLSLEDKRLTIELDEPMGSTQYDTLSFSNQISRSERRLSTKKLIFQYQPMFAGAKTVNDQTIELQFDTFFDPSFLSSESFHLEDLGSPLAATVSTESANLIRLIFNESLKANHSYLLSWRPLINAFGNLVPGHSITLLIDRTAPKILNLEVIHDQMIALQFSEQMESGSVEFESYYQISGLEIDDLNYHPEDSIVEIDFESAMIPDQVYEIKLQSMRDLSGNAMTDTTLQFHYEKPYAPAFGELRITEIMAEPEEGEQEYFELYNASDINIELKGLVWHDGNGETYFESGEIKPQGYLAISSDSDLLSSWLNLNNASETLSLWSEEGLVFSVTYSEDWYDQEDHKGYSLEMVDVESFCGEDGNWTASLSLNGTPGLPNSRSASNPDQAGPMIEQVVVEDQHLLIELNEKLKPNSEIVDHITITPDVDLVSAELDLPEGKRIAAEVIKALEPKTAYELKLSGIEDCVGNAYPNDETWTFYVPESADSLDILINEFLFNPKPGGVDFVELYNQSDKYINLKNMLLVGGSGAKKITQDHLLFHPGSFLVLTSDAQLLSAAHPKGDASRFLELASFPSFNDDEGQVVLALPDGRIIDSLYYDEDMHNPLLDEVEGVSLERVSLKVETMDRNNWQSAGSLAHYATPGLPNSQSREDSGSTARLSVEPKVFLPDGTGQADFTTISYRMEQPGAFANVRIYDSQGRQVRTLAENQLLSTEGALHWDGSTDAGQRAAIGYYIIFVEIYDHKGNQNSFKQTVVLGGRL